MYYFEVSLVVLLSEGPDVIANNSPNYLDYQYVKDAPDTFPNANMEGLTIYPEELKDKFGWI